MLDIHRKPEEILKGRQTLTPKEYGEWKAAVHRCSPDEVEYDPDTDIIWYKPKPDPNYPTTGWPQFLPDWNPPWKPKRKPVKTLGHSLRSFADLAVLTRGWRKPIYKNIRYLYVKDGVIVEYERVRRRLPANALSLAGDLREAAKHVKKRLAALGADSLFMVNNYYSGYSAPSVVDSRLAAVLSKFAALKGHIIINPAWFGLITIKGLAILRELPDIPIYYSDSATGFPLPPGVDPEVWKISDWTYTFTKRRRPVVVSIHDDTVLRELQEISLDKIDTWNQLIDIMAKGEDPSFERPSLDEAGQLLKYGGRNWLLPPDKGRSPRKYFPA